MNLKFFTRLLKRKIIDPDNHIDELAEAMKKGYITAEEVFRLRLERAEAMYKQFLKSKEK